MIDLSGKGFGLREQRPRFSFWVCDLPAVGTWANHLFIRYCFRTMLVQVLGDAGVKMSLDVLEIYWMKHLERRWAGKAFMECRPDTCGERRQEGRKMRLQCMMRQLQPGHWKFSVPKAPIERLSGLTGTGLYEYSCRLCRWIRPARERLRGCGPAAGAVHHAARIRKSERRILMATTLTHQ